MYEFRPMSVDDLPLVQRWLAEPHVVRWWGKPNEQFDLVSADLDEQAMNQFIVTCERRPFGYLQCYDPDAWDGAGLGPQCAGTRGIDQFIGEADMLDRGHGSAFIRSFIDRLLKAGTPVLSQIRILLMRAPFGHMKRPAFKRPAWSIPRMDALS
jgi:aminoglycoside 6'-N-acetyltransferase